MGSRKEDSSTVLCRTTAICLIHIRGRASAVAKLRKSDIDGSAGSVEEFRGGDRTDQGAVAAVQIVIRGTRGFARRVDGMVRE